MDFLEENKTHQSETNLLPLVDIFGALMIMFIVAMPAMLSSISVSLPSYTEQTEVVQKETKKIVIVMKSKTQIYLHDQPVKRQQMLTILASQFLNNQDSTILLYADKSLQYGDVIELFSSVKKIGYENVTLITQNE